MGQAQSGEAVGAAVESSPPPPPPPPPSSSSSSSMDSLLAEAAAFGANENESLEAQAERALNCPCIAGLKNGPCGSQFAQAFLCFLKSTAEEKGSDCVHPFVALQDCIEAHPDAFSKDVLEDDADKSDEALPPDYKMIPPTWALESQSPKPKL